MKTIQLTNLQEGLAGFGVTEATALKQLAHEMQMQDPTFARAHAMLSNCDARSGSGMIPTPY